MGGISKSFSLLLIVILAASSLIMAKPAFAQTLTPSVPTFSLKFIQASYIVTTTDPYTGVNVTQQVDNNTIDVIIKNQPFTAYYDASSNSTISVYYNVQVKGHYAENWTDVYTSDNYPTQSNSSDYTVLSLPSNYPASGQVDFQVQAIIGNVTQVFIPNYLPVPPQFRFYEPSSGSYESVWIAEATSDWSNTQTVTISAASASPSPTPTVPEFPTWTILPLFAVAILLSTVIIRRRIPQKKIAS